MHLNPLLATFAGWVNRQQVEAIDTSARRTVIFILFAMLFAMGYPMCQQSRKYASASKGT